MEKIAFNISLFSYLAASLGYFLYLVYRKPVVSTLATATVGAGLLSHTVWLGLRSMKTGHGPYTTNFEIAMFFAWVIVVVYFLTEWKYKIKDLGAFVIPMAFLALLFSVFMSQEAALVEETETFWLTLHRTLSVIGYAAFTIAFAVAIMYLIQENQVKSKKLGIMYFRMPSLEVLDKLNDKVITIGFPLFTLGFMTGPLWTAKMNQSFFSWDITKTWPLVIVWIIYGYLFFGRLFAGIRGKKAAQGAVLGFVMVVLTYFLHV
ncbi:MAG: cytochrome c biogenesis protein CcsA [Nitrospinae bacterium]|nr:cytochrome c biogenesis protein CcsA [Nitrospinota bacterium]MDA1108392.1 cytochrome c biogenesis protein CcsA [Nitrospinota bacterium]